MGFNRENYARIKEEYDELVKKGLNVNEAFEMIMENHEECSKEQLIQFIN